MAEPTLDLFSPLFSGRSGQDKRQARESLPDGGRWAACLETETAAAIADGAEQARSEKEQRTRLRSRTVGVDGRGTDRDIVVAVDINDAEIQETHVLRRIVYVYCN